MINNPILGTLTLSLSSAQNVRDAHALASATPSPEDLNNEGDIDSKYDADDTQSQAVPPVKAGKSQYELNKIANIKRNKELLQALLNESPILEAGGVAKYIAGPNATDRGELLARYGSYVSMSFTTDIRHVS